MSLESYVEYVRTSDGVSIACVRYGALQTSVPLIATRAPFLSHLQHELTLPFEAVDHEIERMSRSRQIVRFDTRGCGLSDRSVPNITVAARVRDLEAVADHYRLERFAIQGHLSMGAPAIAYAAAHPERVSHLVLAQPYANGRDFWGGADDQALLALARSDWTLYTEVAARRAFGWASDALPPLIAEQMRRPMDGADYLAFADADGATDVTALLPAVRARTLILYYPFEGLASRDAAARLAALLPNASLGILGPLLSTDETIATIEEFLDS